MRPLACITIFMLASSAAFADEGDVHFDFVVAPQLGWLTHPLAATDADADEAGAFVLTVGPHSGPTLVCATGGIYTEEATGGLVQLGTNELCSLIDDHTLGGTSTVVLTPLTNLHASLTACFKTAARDPNVVAASAHAALRLNDFFAAAVPGFDLRTTIPIDATTTPAASLTAEAWAGILLGGLSESAKAYAVASGLDPGVRVTAATLSTALTQDIDDGACVFDGQTATARLVQGNVELTQDALRGSPQGLATSILRFLESERNVSGIAPDNVRDLVQRMQAHTSEIFGDGGGGADIDPPSVAYSEPEAGSTRGGNVRVTVRATDVSAITELAFTAPAQASFTAAVFSCTDASSTDCTLTGTINTSFAPVTDGPLTITTRATDNAGNSTDKDLAIVINNTLPLLNIQAPQQQQTPPQQVSGIFEIIASAQDADGIATLTVEIPGLGLCDDQPSSPCQDLEPATDQLRVRWDTTAHPEGDIALTFVAVDGAGQRDDETITVEVDNNDIGAITGVVDLGAQVVGSTVTALSWTGRVRGAVLGTATTNDEGQYRVTLDDQPHDSVLLVVTDGDYRDVATGLELSIVTGQELMVALGNITAGEVRTANVNAWTTLAAARARHTPAQGVDADAINANNRLLAEHMRRADAGGAPFDITKTVSVDLTTPTPTTVTDERAQLALTHAAFSRRAAELSVARNVAPGTIKLTDVLFVLTADLANDPLLDGNGAAGQLTVSTIPITSLETRFDLTASMDRFIREVPLTGSGAATNVERNLSGITSPTALDFYRALAEDNRPELYPNAGVPFDQLAPAITLDFGGVHAGNEDGDPALGPVSIIGTATDLGGSQVATFGASITGDGTLLLDDDTTPERFSVLVGTDVLPNASVVTDICANAPEAADVAVQDDVVCICAIASDTLENISERIFCFTRPLPEPLVTIPALDGTIFTGGSTVTLSAEATTGFNVQSCQTTLSSEPTGRTAPTPLVATLQPTSCAYNQTVPASTFQDATWTMDFRATDIAGQTATASRSFVVDTTPPTVTGLTLTGTFNPITAALAIPADGAGLARSTYSASLTATDNFDVATVVLELRTQPPTQAAARFICIEGFAGACSLPRAILRGTTPGPCDPTELQLETCTIAGSRSGSTFTATIEDAFNDGARTITVQAFDINGNSNTSVSTTLTKDTVPPIFTWQQPSQQDLWHDMAPGAGVVLPRNNVAFRDNSVPFPAVSNVDPTAVRDAAFSITGNRPSAVMFVWRNKIRGSAFGNDTTVTPTVRSASVDDAVTIRFGAAIGSNTVANCPSTLSLSRAPSASLFRLDLARDNLGVDLATAHDQIVCVRAVPVDAAGNLGAPKDILVRWDTVTPPPTIVVNPNNDDDPDTNDPFQDTAANPIGLLAATSGSFSIFHAYVNNPYIFPIRVKLKPHADAKVDLSDTITTHSAVSSDVRETLYPGTSFTLTAPTRPSSALSTTEVRWDTTGTDGNDSTPNNQIFVKLTADLSGSAAGIIGASKSQNAEINGSFTAANRNDSPIREFRYTNVGSTGTPFRYYTVDASTGSIDTSPLPVTNGFVTIPAGTLEPNRSFRPSIVVAVAQGRLNGAVSRYRMALPNTEITTPTLLRVAARDTEVQPEVHQQKFVILEHPIFDGFLNFDVNGPLGTGTYLHAVNGSSTDLTVRTRCTNSGTTTASCRFYKRWFTLTEMRAQWATQNLGAPRRVLEVETADVQTNVFSSPSAAYLVHPSATAAIQTLRTSFAP